MKSLNETMASAVASAAASKAALLEVEASSLFGVRSFFGQGATAVDQDLVNHRDCCERGECCDDFAIVVAVSGLTDQTGELVEPAVEIGPSRRDCGHAARMWISANLRSTAASSLRAFETREQI